MVETSEGMLDRMDTVEEARAHGDPQRQLMSRQLDERIQEVLAGLTPRERTVFEMRHYQGLRLKTIGEILGTSEEAAKNCLFRATQKMRAGARRFHMRCDEVRKTLPLFLYGELSFDEEERVEMHIDECAGCRDALDREKLLFRSLDAGRGSSRPRLAARVPRGAASTAGASATAAEPASGRKFARDLPFTSISRLGWRSSRAPPPCWCWDFSGRA